MSVSAFLPFIIMVLFITDSYIGNTTTLVESENATISEATHKSCFKHNGLDIGDANTTEAQRIDNSLLEYRIKTPESENFKVMAIRNSFFHKSGICNYHIIKKQVYKNADLDTQSFLHKLQI